MAVNQAADLSDGSLCAGPAPVFCSSDGGAEQTGAAGSTAAATGTLPLWYESLTNKVALSNSYSFCRAIMHSGCDCVGKDCRQDLRLGNLIYYFLLVHTSYLVKRNSQRQERNILT